MVEAPISSVDGSIAAYTVKYNTGEFTLNGAALNPTSGSVVWMRPAGPSSVGGKSGLDTQRIHSTDYDSRQSPATDGLRNLRNIFMNKWSGRHWIRTSDPCSQKAGALAKLRYTPTVDEFGLCLERT